MEELELDDWTFVFDDDWDEVVLPEFEALLVVNVDDVCVNEVVLLLLELLLVAVVDLELVLVLMLMLDEEDVEILVMVVVDWDEVVVLVIVLIELVDVEQACDNYCQRVLQFFP